MNILVQRGLLDCIHVREIAERASRMGCDFEDMAVRSGLLRESQILAILSGEMNIPPVDLDRILPERGAVTGVPLDSFRSRDMFPYSRIGSLMSLAVVNPFDILTLDDVREECGCDLRPTVASRRAIRSAWARFDRAGETIPSVPTSLRAQPRVRLPETTYELAGKKNLLRVLVEYDLLNPGETPWVSSFAKHQGLSLTEAVVRLGIANEHQIALVFARQWGLPTIDVSRYPIPASMRRLVPLPEMRSRELILLDRVDNVTLVAIAGLRFEDSFIDRLEVHGPVHLFITRLSQLREALARLERAIEREGA